MNNLTLALKISDFEFDHDYLNKIFKMNASAIHSKGQFYYTGPAHNQIQKSYESNYWEYRAHIMNNSVWIKTVVDKFVEEFILNNRDTIMKIKNDCKIELYVGINYRKDEDLDSFHFDLPLIKLFADLNIEIDIDQSIS